jgi:hypothetical protein
VTTSYVSPAMRALDEEAKKAGVIVYNEIGLDPGIDHLWAVKAIGDVRAKGGKVRGFALLHSLLVIVKPKLAFSSYYRSSNSTLIVEASPPPCAHPTHLDTNSAGAAGVSCWRC